MTEGPHRDGPDESAAQGDKTSLNLRDPVVQACPWAAYREMREQGPVYHDPVTGHYIVTRYDDLRRVLADDRMFNTSTPDKRNKPWLQTPIGRKVLQIWQAKGWPPENHLQELTGEAHSQVRSTMSGAFIAPKIKEMEPLAAGIVKKLIDSFIDDGTCDWVKQFATPLPLNVIGTVTGIDEQHLPKILEWVDAYTALTGIPEDEAEAMAYLDKFLEGQHFFHAMIERFRKTPDGSLLSNVVNAVIPGQNRKFTDRELHQHIESAFFVAGAETTRNTLGEGMRVLVEQNDVWLKLKSDPTKYLRLFVEELLRTASATQGLPKFAQDDTEVGGVHIPKGALVMMRYAAANRDERHFEDPEVFNMERPGVGTHLAFGTGPHVCLGASLARLELRLAFAAVIERFSEIQFSPGKNDFAYHPNIALRGLKALHVDFKKASPAG